MREDLEYTKKYKKMYKRVSQETKKRRQ